MVSSSGGTVHGLRRRESTEAGLARPWRLRWAARLGRGWRAITGFPAWCARGLAYFLLCRRGFHRAHWRPASGWGRRPYDELVCPICLAPLAARPAAGSEDWTAAMATLFSRNELRPELEPMLRRLVFLTPRRGQPAPAATTRTRPVRIA